MGKLVYCTNCKLFSDCERAEYCGCCFEGEDYEETENT